MQLQVVRIFALKSPYFNCRIIPINQRSKMSKIRMNTELRTKILNRYRESAEKENTQELESMKQAREQVDLAYPKTFELARQVVERSYPSEDVATCRTLKQKYGQPLDVVAKDKCFYFSYAK
jgi:hypothetical protein